MQLIQTWAQALRPHQWSKNLLLFVPLIVGHAYHDFSKIAATNFGFMILCVLASATYIINDLVDLKADQSHPTKRERPFASGRLSIISGLVVALLMITGAFAAAFALSPAFALMLLAYLALTTVYSLVLRRLPLVDVFAIGILFTLRIVMGTVLIGTEYSPWLLSFSLSFFLSLALAKRHGELIDASRTSAGMIADRGYRADDWPLTLAFGIGAGVTSIIIMLLYVTNDAAPSGFYNNLAWLYVMPAVMMIWLMRIWLLAHRSELHDDPVIFALRDWISLALGVVVMAAFVLAL